MPQLLLDNCWRTRCRCRAGLLCFVVYLLGKYRFQAHTSISKVIMSCGPVTAVGWVCTEDAKSHALKLHLHLVHCSRHLLLVLQTMGPNRPAVPLFSLLCRRRIQNFRPERAERRLQQWHFDTFSNHVQVSRKTNTIY